MNSKFEHNTDTIVKFGMGSWMSRSLCWLAAFPYVAYSRIETPSTRARVMANGLAVIISPTVLAMVLIGSGQSLVGQSPYLLLLPLVVFAIERLLIALSYQQGNRSGLLTVVRLIIVLISLCLSIYAALLSERVSLIQRLHIAEDAISMEQADAKKLTDRIAEIDKRIASNEKLLGQRSAIQLERLAAIRLHDLECKGQVGRDPKTGIIIKGGGKCGSRAETYLINANEAQGRLDMLDGFERENDTYKNQKTKLEDKLGSMLAAKRSPDSLGSLARAVSEADGGLWFKIVVLSLIITMIETSALVMSKVPVSDTLQAAVDMMDKTDNIGLAAWSENLRAAAARQRQDQRTQVANGLVPLTLRFDSTVESAAKATRRVA